MEFTTGATEATEKALRFFSAANSMSAQLYFALAKAVSSVSPCYALSKSFSLDYLTNPKSAAGENKISVLSLCLCASVVKSTRKMNWRWYIITH